MAKLFSPTDSGSRHRLPSIGLGLHYFLQPTLGVGIAFQASDLAYIIFSIRLWESASPSKSRTWLTLFSPAGSGSRHRLPTGSGSQHRLPCLGLGLNYFLLLALGVGIVFQVSDLAELFSPAGSGSRHRLPSLRLGLIIFSSRLWESASPSKSRTWRKLIFSIRLRESAFAIQVKDLAKINSPSASRSRLSPSKSGTWINKFYIRIRESDFAFQVYDLANISPSVSRSRLSPSKSRT
ncbi:ATP-dependent RecD-like DNA-helicase [Sesbania bispinosa]|nr:ATP-dependent RecD-like DNA-helicase [Sesbania bispinosa]